jgi:UDP-GlcNAc:undecaprenyl-phosphate GlcNAc-1-phosphate transferase
VNLIDGLDGLAADRGHRCRVVLLVRLSASRHRSDRPRGEPLSRHHRRCVLPNVTAKIFMGDVTRSCSADSWRPARLVGGQTSDQFSGQVFFFFAPLFIPFFVMGVPILDTAFAIVRRARKRSGVAEADKDHLHHRLMRLGHGHRVTVLILWLWTGLLAVFVLVPVYTSKGDVVPLGVGFWPWPPHLPPPGLRRRRGGRRW